MYNMPEFNLIIKEDTMSQGSKGSTKVNDYHLGYHYAVYWL